MSWYNDTAFASLTPKGYCDFLQSYAVQAKNQGVIICPRISSDVQTIGEMQFCTRTALFLSRLQEDWVLDSRFNHYKKCPKFDKNGEEKYECEFTIVSPERKTSADKRLKLEEMLKEISKKQLVAVPA